MFSMNKMSYDFEEQLNKTIKFIKNNPKCNKIFLQAIQDSLKEYFIQCEKYNNHELREALGDACHILGKKKKPNIKDMATFHCIRIKKAIFPNGITNYHHEGERNFYNLLWGDKKNE